MVAFGHTTAFLLGAAFLISCTAAAPTTAAEGDLAQTQALDYPNEAGASRCYYNFQHYEEGDRIVTNEPCLNCTCHKRMLMCYLRVCPFTKAVGQDCTVEKRPDQCCPVITCPQVPVDILTSSTTTEASASTAVGHPSTYGCTLEDNTFYPDGVQMPSDPKTPCELCYCIRNHTACVRQECTLNVEGCRPIYQEGVCCPVRYDCEYNELTTTERPSSGGLLLSSTASPLQCRFGESLYNDGELIESDKPCESCYCMRGDIVCAVRSCGEPMAGKDCEALPPPEGECCPTVYQCANGTVPVDALSTESSIIMHTADIQTQSPPKESDLEPSIDEATKTDGPVSLSEITTSATKEDDQEQDNVENDKPEVVEHDTLPEHVESDPLDDLEEDEVLGGIIPVDDTKPDNMNVATESPAYDTPAPVQEGEKESDYQGEKVTTTTGPVELEHEGTAESHSKPGPESSEPFVVSHDTDQAHETNIDPEHIQYEQEVSTTAAADFENVEDQAPTQAVSSNESENKGEQTEANPLETDMSASHGIGGTVQDSEPEATDNTDTKPAEDASDDGVAHLEPEVEIKPQEETSSLPVDESFQEETAPKDPDILESLDQKKDEDLSSPTNDVVPTDKVSDEHVDTKNKPDSAESSEPSQMEGVDAPEETPKPSLDIENEGIQKEPVPPRKEDAVPEEPRPTQHAEGSMTKAEDSIPTDLSPNHPETDVLDKLEEIDSMQNNENPSGSDIKPTASLQPETFTPTKEEVVQSTLPEVPSVNNLSPQEGPKTPTFGDEVWSESLPDKLEEPNHSTKVEESTSLPEETVPNVVVTESEAETPAENVSEENSKDESEANASETIKDGAIVEEASHVETETPITDNKAEDNVVQDEKVDGETPSEQSNEKHADDSKEPESPNVTNDEVVVGESSTDENEVVGESEDNNVPGKEQEPGTFEEHSPSTEHDTPVESEQDQTEINEIISENSETQPDKKVPLKENHTEVAPSEGSSTDPLIKLGNEVKPEGTVYEEETNASSDSKPAESQSSESENVPHHDNPELNVFQDDLHDPVELDPTDFDDQLEDSDHLIHNEMPSENEIVDDHHPGHGGSLDHKRPVHLPGPIGVVPGEGDCLIEGKTYTNNSEIPSRSPCHKICTCMSSIVHCQGIDCPPPPPQLANCMPVHQGDLCCPVYTCDGNTPESPETDNQVVIPDKTAEPVVPEEKPVPSEESEVATEQSYEVVTEQIHEVTNEPDHEVATEEQQEVVTGQPHEVMKEPDHEVTTEEQQEAVTSQPHEVVTEQSYEEATEEHHELVTGQPHEVLTEQHQDAVTEEHHAVSSEHPGSPVKVTNDETLDMPVETPEQAVQIDDEHLEEISRPETSEEISPEQGPTTEEMDESTNVVETSQSTENHQHSDTEESHKEGYASESTDDKDPEVVDQEEQKPTEENEPEVQTATPQDSAVVADEKLETEPNSGSNDLSIEGNIESHPETLTDEGEGQEAEVEHSLSTDLPTIQGEVPSKPESDAIIHEPEGGSNSEEGVEHDNPVTNSPADPAAGVVYESSTEVGEDKITVTETPTAKPIVIDSASSDFEHVTSAENDSGVVKHPVQESIESDDKLPHISGEVQETPNEGSALEDSSAGEEVNHELAVQGIHPHTEVGSLNEENLTKQPENSGLYVTDLPVESNPGPESDDIISNAADQQPQSPESAEPSSSDDVKEHETATAAQEGTGASVAEGSNESVTESGDEVNPIEAHIDSQSESENIKEMEESQTNLPSVLEDDKNHYESSVAQGVSNAVTEVSQAAEISESGTVESHDFEVTEAVPTEGPLHEVSETVSPVQEGKPNTHSTIISGTDLTQTLVDAPVDTEIDGSEEPIVLSEVHSDSSVESEKVPLPEIPSSEAQLNITVPESSEEQVTTIVYKDHDESVESGEKLSEPIDEENESSPEETSGDTTPLIENEENSPQPMVPESESHLEQEDTEVTVTEAANPAEETENHPTSEVPNSDLASQPEQEHEVEQPSVSNPEQESDSEDIVVPENNIEQTVKPVHEGQSSGGEDHVHTEETSETAHEDIKPELEQDHKEPVSHVEVQSVPEELTHHEEEHSTHSGEDHPQRPEHPSEELENNVQQPEHPIHEAELPESILPHLPTEEEDGDSKPSLPIDSEIPTEDQFPTGAGDMDYDANEDGAFGPGTCRYGGKVYVSAQQIPRDDPCDFCFCFRSDIICLQQSCPPPIHRCHQEPIQGYCCPRYQCPVSMATSLNLTTTTTTTTTTLPPHFFAHAYQGAARQAGCLHRGRAYSVGEEITSESGPCLHCICGSDGEMKCDPVVCSPEPMLRKMMEAAASQRRR